MSPIQQFQEEWAFNVPIPEPDSTKNSMVSRYIPTPDASEIDRVIAGERTPACTSVEEAIGAVRMRFGVAYTFLPDALQQNKEVVWEAMLASSGQILKTTRGRLYAMSQDRSFFVEALHHGMPDWIVQYASAEVRNDPEIQSLIAIAEEERKNYLQRICSRRS